MTYNNKKIWCIYSKTLILVSFASIFPNMQDKNFPKELENFHLQVNIQFRETRKTFLIHQIYQCYKSLFLLHLI